MGVLERKHLHKWISQILMSVHLFSVSWLAGSLEVAYEARAASGEPGKAEDCGWRGGSEGKS